MTRCCTRASLTYASDMTLLDTAVRPHGRVWGEEGLMMASLDHAMWFHRPFRADDWLLYDQDTPSSSGSRGLGRGNLFTQKRAPRGHRRPGGPDPGAPRMRRLAGLVAVVALLGACSDDEPATDTTTSSTTATTAPGDTTTSTAPPPAPMLDSIELGIQEIAEVDEPIALGGAARVARPVHRGEGRTGAPHRGRGGRVR